MPEYSDSLPQCSDLTSAIHRIAPQLERIQDEAASSELESAPRFSAFRALFPNEIRLSGALAYLLDPNETHGQGTTFLDQFLDLIDRPNLRGKPVQVTRESSTGDRRRIDIVLQFRDSVIGIENKPWTSESGLQCHDYVNELQKRQPGEPTLVFLTKDGRPSCTAEKYLKFVIPLSYAALGSALRARAPAVREFLNQLFLYIQGEPVMSKADQEVLDCLLQPENIGTALKVVTLAAQIRERIIADFSKALLRKVNQEDDLGMDWNLYPEHDWEKPNSGFYLYHPGWEHKYGIGFSNGKDEGREVIFGVSLWKKPRWDEEVRAKVRKALKEALGEGNPGSRPDAIGTEQWFWHLPLRQLDPPAPEYDNWHSAQVLHAMSLNGSEKATKELYPLVRTAIQATSAILDEAAR